MRSSCIVLAAVTICLAAPAYAQEDAKKAVEQLASKFEEHYNKQDAAGIAGLFTKDGVLVSQGATMVKAGPQAIEQGYAAGFKMGLNHTNITVDQVSPFGTDAAIGMGEYHSTGQGEKGPLKFDGHWTAVDVREGGVWKVRLLTAVPNPPPPAAASTR